MIPKNIFNGLLCGLAIGDALGVPVEFVSRETILKNPVSEMRGYGTYNQPPGTWSDDSSLSFCLAESLTRDGGLENIAQNMVRWKLENYWAARGEVFDIGNSTRVAIDKLNKGLAPTDSGGTDEFSNGNGSLMRIAPLVFFLLDKPIHKRFEITRQVSGITHAHIRSVIACFYYLEFARQLLKRKDKFEIYRHLKNKVTTFLHSMFIDGKEIEIFDRVLKENIYELAVSEIESSGYVVHTLEASLWSFLTTENYSDAVLKAVNLGDDTDTTASVTGGWAGMLYGYETIPYEWIKAIARKDDIEELAKRMGNKFNENLKKAG